MIKIGNKVHCRFWNTPEERFIGDHFDGVVIEINRNSDTPYLVEAETKSFSIWLLRKEIKRILS